MSEQKCDFDIDCDSDNICVLPEKRCVPSSYKGLIGFQVGKKVYHAKTTEEIEFLVQQLVLVNKLDLNSMKCNAGMDLTMVLPVNDFVGHTFKDLRKQFLEEKENPANLVSIINSVDGHIYCETLETLKKYFRSKLRDKNFKGALFPTSTPVENIEEYVIAANRGKIKVENFVNFPLWGDKFILIDNTTINNLATVVYYLVKITSVKWVDTNSRTIASSYHNYHRNGDDLYMLVPVGDRKFFCNEYNGKCRSLFWDRQQSKPALWDESNSSLKNCQDNGCHVNKNATNEFLQYLIDNDLESMKKLFAKGAVDINEQYENGTFIHFAIENGDTEMVTFLIEAGADIFVKVTLGIVAGSENVELFEDDTLLHVAIRHNEIDIVKLLVKEGIDVNSRNAYGETPLQLAAEFSEVKTLKFLLKNGAKINEHGFNELTAIHRAVMSSNIENIKFLVKKGADINDVDYQNKTVLHLANYDNIELVMYLADNVKDINARDELKRTCLHYAAYNSNNINVINYLIEKGANITLTDKDGRTPLIYAIMESENDNKIDIVRFLIKNGSDVNSADVINNSPLHYCVGGTNPKILKLLLDNGAKIDSLNIEGQTAFHTALRANDINTAKILIKNGAKVNIKDVHNVSSFDLLNANRSDFLLRDLTNKNF